MTSRAVGLALALVAIALPLFRGGSPLSPETTDFAGTLALLLVAAMILALAPGPSVVGKRAFALVFDTPRGGFNAALFLATAGVGAAVSLLLFRGLPFLDDGVASLFQARIFARGAVTFPLPANASFFELFCVIGAKAGTGRWSGMYPPGWPALLVPGVMLGAPWLVNPLLAGGLAVATAELGRELFGDKAGRVAGILALSSPYLVILSGTHLSHTATALFCTICFRAVLRLQRTGATRHGVVAGASWGAAFLCRPVDALLLGALFAIVPLSGWRTVLSRWRGIVAALAVAFTAAVTMAAFQKAVTGDPLTPGHKIGMGKVGGFGFIHLKGRKWHTPAKAVDFTLRRFRVLSDRLTGWPVPFFLIALAAFLPPGAKGREALLLAPPFLLAGVFAFYWYYEMYLPARYLSAGGPLLIVLAARGFCLVHEAAGRRGDRPARIAAAAAAASVMFALVVVVPAEARQVRLRAGDVEHTLPRVVEAYRIRNAVVFMDAVSPGISEEERLNDFYAAGFLRNDLDLAGNVIYARNYRERNGELMAAYPGRDYYLYRYHRDSRRAYLYRYIAAGDKYCLEPVAPVTTDLMLPTPAERAVAGCVSRPPAP